MTFLAAVHEHGTADLVFLLGVIIVVGCLLGAAYLAYLSNFIGCVLLILVAIIAGFLLL